MNIAIKSGNTNAWIKATNNHCKCNNTGTITGKSNHTKKLDNDDNQTNNIPNSNHHEVIFQNNLNDKDIILAQCHTNF